MGWPACNLSDCKMVNLVLMVCEIVSKLFCYLYRFCLLFLRRTCCHSVTIAFYLYLTVLHLAWDCCHDYCLIFFQVIKSASEYCSSYAMHHVLHICIKPCNGIQIDRCYLMPQSRAWWLVKISIIYKVFSWSKIRSWWGHSQYSRPGPTQKISSSVKSGIWHKFS